MSALDAARLTDRLIITGRLDVPRALHIGSGQASQRADAAIRRDRNGQPYIPGSSLAGLLRSLAEDFADYLCPDPATTLRGLFGRLRKDDPRDETLGASRLLVEDARIEAHLPPDVEVRDHVGIDRRRGAARPHLQYDREVSPSNTAYHLEITLEEPRAEELRLLLAVLDFWAEHGLQVGARCTTGLGEARLDQESLEYHALDFRSPLVLRDYLLGGGNDAAYFPRTSTTRKGRSALDPLLSGVPKPAPLQASSGEMFCPQHLFVDLALVLEEPLLVKGNVPEIPDPTGQKRASDAEFVKALRRGAQQGQLVEELYIPGSSLKGVLRTRAEKIVRTLNFYRDLTVDQAEEQIGQAEQEYTKRIAACAVTHDEVAEPQWERLESCGNQKRQKKARKCKAKGIYEGSCLICRVFGNSLMRSRLTCSEATLLGEAPPQKLFDHVAIDRFTGGAADAKKFDTRPLMPARTDGSQASPVFTFRLHLERFELWMLGLLGHLLKDLHESDVRVGHATRRGYGLVRAYVTGASVLVLPGTDLAKACAARQVPLQVPTLRWGYYHGPYLQAGVTDHWKALFGETAWGPAGPAAPLLQSPGALLLADADSAFQKQVEEAERRRHGVFDGSAQHSNE